MTKFLTLQDFLKKHSRVSCVTARECFSIIIIDYYTTINPKDSITENMSIATMHTGAIYFITTVKSFFALNLPESSISSIMV